MDCQSVRCQPVTVAAVRGLRVLCCTTSLLQTVSAAIPRLTSDTVNEFFG